MTLMLSPVPNRSFSSSAGNVYTSDKDGVIKGVGTPQDVTDLVAQGCAVLSPPPSDLLFSIRGANFNIATDQILVPTFIGKWRAKRITILNASISLTTAVGGFYTGASKGGSALVANTQVYSSLTAALLALDATLALPNLVLAAATPLFLSLTTPEGTAATADIQVYGDVYV